MLDKVSFVQGGRDNGNETNRVYVQLLREERIAFCVDGKAAAGEVSEKKGGQAS